MGLGSAASFFLQRANFHSAKNGELLDRDQLVQFFASSNQCNPQLAARQRWLNVATSGGVAGSLAITEAEQVTFDERLGLCPFEMEGHATSRLSRIHSSCVAGYGSRMFSASRIQGASSEPAVQINCAAPQLWCATQSGGPLDSVQRSRLHLLWTRQADGRRGIGAGHDQPPANAVNYSATWQPEILTDLANNSLGQVVVFLRVDFGCVHSAVPQNDLCGFKAEPVSNLRRGRVADLIRMPNVLRPPCGRFLA